MKASLSVSKRVKNRQGERMDKYWTRQQKWTSSTELTLVTLHLYLAHTGNMLGLWALQFYL